MLAILQDILIGTLLCGGVLICIISFAALFILGLRLIVFLLDEL